MYLQGMSSSLPEEVQLKFYHTIKGLEHCLIMRPAYAIEYDCVDPLAMNPTLEFKDFEGLFGAVNLTVLRVMRRLRLRDLLQVLMPQ